MVSVSGVFHSIAARMPKPQTLITKGAGLAALAMVVSDAHYVGKIQADLYASEKDASSTGFYLNNTLYQNNMSRFQSKIKDLSYKFELDQTYKRFFNEGIGYNKGFFSMLVHHVVPLGLGLGALFAKGKASVACAVGVGVYGAYEFLKNFFAWGVPPGLDKFN